MLGDMTKEQLAWFAGIIDGEGCISISLHIRTTYKQYHPYISVNNTDKRLVDTIVSWVGIGNLCEYKGKNKRHKTAWRWEVGSFSDILEVLLKVLPYLVIKQEQAVIVANFCVSELAGKCDNPESYWMQVKALNRKGEEV